MPPRSTNAPKSAMFFTTPLRSWPTSSCLSSSVFFCARSASMRLRRLTTILRRASSILSTRHLISLPMYSPMSCGRRISTCDAGRNTFTPMSTSRPPLILRVTMPLTTSFSWTVSMTFIHFSIFSAFRLREDDHAAIVLPAGGDVFGVFNENANLLADLRDRVAFFPLVAGNDAFALVADVDEDKVVVDPQHVAFDDLIGANVAALEPAHVFGQRIADGDVASLRPKRRTHELDCD